MAPVVALQGHQDSFLRAVDPWADPGLLAYRDPANCDTPAAPQTLREFIREAFPRFGFHRWAELLIERLQAVAEEVQSWLDGADLATTAASKFKAKTGEVERAVTKAISVAPTSNQFAAMTSLCFNIGPTNFAKSSVVRRMNEGNPKAAADAFLLWNKAGGKVLKGLTARREDEKKLFLTRST
jgi:GH24 family phage-related lysozyme (muramidase)